MFAGSLIGGLASSAANAYAAHTSYKGQQEANDTNVYLAQQNREWNERMSNSAYQRAAEDMQKAGINPILAFSSGMSHASTPNTAAAIVKNPSESSSQFVSKIANSAISAYHETLASQKNQAELKNIQSQTRVNQASESKIKADTDLSLSHRGLADAHTGLTVTNNRKSQQEIKSIISRTQSQNLENVVTETDARRAQISNDALESIKDFTDENPKLAWSLSKTPDVLDNVINKALRIAPTARTTIHVHKNYSNFK